MAYDAFLLASSQLRERGKARLVIDGENLFIESAQIKNRWLLYTRVYFGEGYLPNSIRSCVSSSGVLRWQQTGAYLKLDPLTYSVFLFQEVEMEEGKYIPFRHHLSDFTKVAAEWREILHDFEQAELSQIDL